MVVLCCRPHAQGGVLAGDAGCGGGRDAEDIWRVWREVGYGVVLVSGGVQERAVLIDGVVVDVRG